MMEWTLEAIKAAANAHKCGYVGDGCLECADDALNAAAAVQFKDARTFTIGTHYSIGCNLGDIPAHLTVTIDDFEGARVGDTYMLVKVGDSDV